MHARLLLAFTLLCLVACEGQRSAKVVTGAWLEGRARFAPARQLATTESASCRRELFGVAELKREVQFYEQQLSGERRLTGRWRHLDLAKLPVPQARFLRTVGENFGDLNLAERADVRHCQDAVCVVNAVYQSRDGLEGLMTYLWFLKMGNVLAFKNHIYHQKERPGIYNQKSYPLGDYLFSRDEFYAFWKMTHALSAPFKTLPKMREIQRIPRKSLIEGESARTCGLAWSSGYVLLNDGCLSFWSDDLETGFIYEGTTHELAHQIDYHYGATRAAGSLYYSQVGVWKELGKWSSREYFSAAENGVVIEWTSGLADKDFVRSYARTSPAEHFADTAAYYRFDGETTKKKVPATVYGHLKTEVFEHLEYDAAGLLQQFERDVVPLFSSEIFKLAVECEQEPGEGILTAPLAAASFPFVVSESVRRCLAAGLSATLDQAMVEAKINHVDGCRALNKDSDAQRFRERLRVRFTEQLVEHVKVARENLEHYKLLASFYKDLESRAVPLQLATGCYGEIDEAVCYQAAIASHIDELLPRDLATSKRLRDDLRRMYLDANRFDVVQSEARKLHLDFLRTQSAVLLGESQELWERCASVALDNREAPRSGAFSVGQGFMVSGQFNCLNQRLPEVVRRAIGEMSYESFTISDSQESKLLFDLAVPLVVQELTRRFEIAVLEEFTIAVDVMAQRRVQLKTRLLSDLSWAKELGQQLRPSCQRILLVQLPSELRYHQVTALYGTFVEDICTDILRSPDFRLWLQERQAVVESELLKTFVGEYRREAHLRADRCIDIYPLSNTALRLLHKRKRDACYLERWHEVEARAFDKAYAPYREHFSFGVSTFVSRASRELAQIRDQVMQERFSGTTPRVPAPVENRSIGTSVGGQVEEGLRRTGEALGGWLRDLGATIQNGVDESRRRP